MSRNDQEKPYGGLLGLDGLHPAWKVLNLVLTVVIGTKLAWASWYRPIADNHITYDFVPFSWPLIFLFAWPICALILWLRLTGLRWRWGLLAGILILAIYLFLNALFDAIGQFIS